MEPSSTAAGRANGVGASSTDRCVKAEMVAHQSRRQVGGRLLCTLAQPLLESVGYARELLMEFIHIAVERVNRAEVLGMARLVKAGMPLSATQGRKV